MTAVYGPHTAPADNRIFDTWHHRLDFDDADMDTDQTTGMDGPAFWPNTTGAIADPDPPANTVVGKPLKAIQITIQFLDTASGQMRQVTLVEAMRD